MTIFDEYVAHCCKHRRLYGDRTVVLMEVGSFFEMNDDGKGNGSDVRGISALLNIVCTKKNKNIPEVSRTNPLLAGFPTGALRKYLPVLLEHGYTVVMVTQTTPPPSPKRAVTKIYSAGTFVDDISSPQSNFLMSVYVDATPSGVTFAGCAVLDASTGACRTGQALSSAGDPHAALDEIYRWLRTCCPVEVVLCGTFGYGDLVQRLELTRSDGCCAHDFTGTAFDKNLACLDYQEAVFAKAYPESGQPMLSAIERLGLERADWARVAFAALIRFAYNHDETIIDRLAPPGLLDHPNKLTVCYNTLGQLAVHSGKAGTPASRRGEGHAAAGHGTLLRVLNRCITPMGKRLFTERLLNPINDPTALTARYAMVAACIDVPCDTDQVRRQLATVSAGSHDLERICRRLSLGAAQPLDFVHAHECLAVMQALLEAGTVARAVLGGDAQAVVRGVADDVGGFFDLAAAATYPGHARSFMAEGVDPRLDALHSRVRKGAAALEKFAAAFTGKLVDDRDVVCTPKRFKDCDRWQHPLRDIADLLGDAQGDDDVPLAAPTSARFRDGNCRVEHELLHRLADEISTASAELHAGLRQALAAFQDHLWRERADDLRRIAACIAELDVATTSAINARTFGYCRPSIAIGEPDTGRSWLKARALRHPIIERIQADAREYVPNDVSIGTPGSQGMLLYGLNAAGKSSLVKAIGLNVLMAQAGFYVAADAFELRPYSQLFTRISTGDDVVKGQSTFTIEMSELRNILTRCDERSLVLGDELCAGTESRSAIAIVSAGLAHIDARGSSYAFATHLHELEAVPEVGALDELRMFHLTVEMQADGQLVYERRLQEGSGATLYGLEVCRALRLPPSFLQAAQSVRQKLLGLEPRFVSTRRSRYNARQIVDVCAVCKVAKAEHTHHKRPQQAADSDGLFPRGVHMNQKHNLQPVCRACHALEHHSS